MTFRQLDNLVKVVEYGSFLKAAEALFISSQALNQQVNSLEDELGVKLLARSTKGVTLTPVGEVFYNGAKNILAMQNTLINDVKKIAMDNQQTILIGSCFPLSPNLIHKVFTEFMLENSGEKVIIVQSNIDQLLENTISGRIDICEVGNSPELKKYNLCFEPLCDFGRKWVCLMSPLNALSKKRKIRPEDLAGCRIAIPNSSWYEPLIKYLQTSSIDAVIEEYEHASSEINEISNITNICLNERDCVAILPCWSTRSHQSLASVPFDFYMKMEYGFAYRPSSKPGVLKFVSTAKDLASNGVFLDP